LQRFILRLKASTLAKLENYKKIHEINKAFLSRLEYKNVKSVDKLMLMETVATI